MGDAFDTAVMEILRTLDGQDKVKVLAPWTPDLAPLVAVALVDTAPSFDPEGGLPAASTRSRIVPYTLAAEDVAVDSDEAREREAAFWNGTHLSLGREGAESLTSAMADAPPTHLVVLGLPQAAADVAAAVEDRVVKIFCFGSLVSRWEIAEGLGVPLDWIEDLEGRLPSREAGSEEASSFARERDAEEPLEPYVPYGLLLQDALGDFLPGDEQEGGEAV
ncbi:MAG: hypothetical protein ACOY9C_13865 [Pseudomonadota bacterium]